ncbi:MAG: Uma2 family endonuclease [Burkholderiales bacterium]|nr:Uma2 family endonuclease [Anaerolineae bacterium]
MSDATRIRMTLAEFKAMPETSGFVEFIAGEVIVSPTPKYPHQQSVAKIHLYLDGLDLAGEIVLSPMDVYFGEDALEPDVFWVMPGGRCQLGEDGYWYGAPDLVVEVASPSTVYRDRGRKFEIYEEYGVREYWLVDTDARFIEVYALVDGRFERKGVFGKGTEFTSAVLGQTVKVDMLFK